MKIIRNFYTMSKALSEQIFTELEQERENMSTTERKNEAIKIQKELDNIMKSAESKRAEHAKYLSDDKYTHFKLLVDEAVGLAQDLQINIFAETQKDLNGYICFTGCLFILSDFLGSSYKQTFLKLIKHSRGMCISTTEQNDESLYMIEFWYPLYDDI